MLENKVIIVTGGGSGMGQTSAIMFAEVGAKILVADWSEEGGRVQPKRTSRACASIRSCPA